MLSEKVRLPDAEQRCQETQRKCGEQKQSWVESGYCWLNYPEEIATYLRKRRVNRPGVAR